jgi:hypothetical protein
MGIDEVELAAYEPDSGYGDSNGITISSRARDLGRHTFKSGGFFLIEGGRAAACRPSGPFMPRP